MPPAPRVAHWMVAWSLRNLGRPREALEIPMAPKAELDAIVETCPYVDQVIALLCGQA